MQNELSVIILRCSSVFSMLRAKVMAASSALLIVCIFCDLMSMCVTFCVRGLTTPARSVLLLFTCEPSVHTKSLGFHFLLWGWVFSIVVVWCVCIGWVCLCRTCSCLC